MARRKKSARRRSPKTTSLLNVAEAYAQANVLTMGALNTTPVGFVMGATDLGFKSESMQAGMLGRASTMVSVGAGSISLGDIVSQPDQAFGIIQSNVMNNWQGMIVQSAGINIGFRLGKKLLRRPISSVNRNIFKQLGLGVRL
jgi:hypothetical protein